LQAKPASAVTAKRCKLVATLVLASLKLNQRWPPKLTKNAMTKPSALASSGHISCWVRANTPMCVSAAAVPTARNQMALCFTLRSDP